MLDNKNEDIEGATHDADGPYGRVADGRPVACDEYQGQEVPDVIGKSQVVAVVLSVVMAVMLMSLPFAMHMGIVRRDLSLAGKMADEAMGMDDAERLSRLMTAQRHNALVSGWSGWPASVNNEGMAGAKSSVDEDIPLPQDTTLDSGDGEPATTSACLDMGDGLIGWAILPTGRAVVVTDDYASRNHTDIGRLAWERWSCLPVGGHGSLCVLSLMDGDSSSVIREDLLSMEIGDVISVGVLGDMYSYEVARIEDGAQTDVTMKTVERSGDDSIAILIGKDGDGNMTSVLANRIRYDGTSRRLSSAPVDICQRNMIVGMSVGFLSVLVFLLAWRSKLDERMPMAPAEGDAPSEDASRDETEVDGTDLELVAKYALDGVSQDVVDDVMRSVSSNATRHERQDPDGGQQQQSDEAGD